MGKGMNFVEPADVETQVFDWGKLWWVSEPRVTPAERFSVGVADFAAGKGFDRHNHPGVEEVLYIISGTGTQMIETPAGPVEREIGPGMLIHVPPDVFHSTFNTGPDTLRLLVVYSPPGVEAHLREMAGVTIEPPQRG